MPNEKISTLPGEILARLGIGKHRNVYKNTYNELHDAEKYAVEKASGIIAIINAATTETPEFIFDLIQKKFPDVTKENLQADLMVVANWLKKYDALVGATLDETLQNIKNYLSSYEGETWAIQTKNFVELLMIVFKPKTTPIQKLASVLEIVYQGKVKQWIDDLIKGIFKK